MSRELPFLIYCLEEYKAVKGLSGKQVAALFAAKKVMEYIVEFFEVLHINGPQYIIQDIDEYIAQFVKV